MKRDNCENRNSFLFRFDRVANLRSNGTLIKQNCTKAGSCCSQDPQQIFHHGGKSSFRKQPAHPICQARWLPLCCVRNAALNYSLLTLLMLLHGMINMESRSIIVVTLACSCVSLHVFPCAVKPLSFLIRILYCTWTNMWLFPLTVLIHLVLNLQFAPSLPPVAGLWAPSGPPVLGKHYATKEDPSHPSAPGRIQKV